jgi:hypothetical protein
VQGIDYELLAVVHNRKRPTNQDMEDGADAIVAHFTKEHKV